MWFEFELTKCKIRMGSGEKRIEVTGHPNEPKTGKANNVQAGKISWTSFFAFVSCLTGLVALVLQIIGFI